MPHVARVAIVGAGIAGLTAALTLRDAGLACDLYEAADRVGGRVHSLAGFWADGMLSEWCGEFIDGDHTLMRQLAARFGLELVALDRDGSAQAPTLRYLGGQFVTDGAPSLDGAAVSAILRDQAGEAGYPTTWDSATPAARALDQISAHAWVERHVPGGHANPLGRILDAACAGLYGLDTTEQSALNLVYLFAGRDFSQGQVAARPLAGTTKIAGGNARLPQAIAGTLPGGALHLGHTLTAIARDDASHGGHGSAPLTLTFASASGETLAIEYDAAILALPFTALRQADYASAGFDDRKRDAIENLGYGTISKLTLEFDRPYWFDDGPWPHPHSGFLITDTDLQTVWDTSLGQSGAHGLLVNYTSGHRGAAYSPPAPYTTTADAEAAPELQRATHDCLERLERVFPGVSGHYTGRAALSYPTGDPRLRGAYSCWKVGQYTRFAGYEGARQGPIHFAGEHCSLTLQGYMEGAAREGVRAAREVVGEIEEMGG